MELFLESLLLLNVWSSLADISLWWGRKTRCFWKLGLQFWAEGRGPGLSDAGCPLMLFAGWCGLPLIRPGRNPRRGFVYIYTSWKILLHRKNYSPCPCSVLSSENSWSLFCGPHLPLAVLTCCHGKCTPEQGGPHSQTRQGKHTELENCFWKYRLLFLCVCPSF